MAAQIDQSRSPAVKIRERTSSVIHVKIRHKDSLSVPSYPSKQYDGCESHLRYSCMYPDEAAAKAIAPSSSGLGSPWK